MALLLAFGIWTYLPWTKPGAVDPHQAPFLNVPFLIIRTLGGQLLFFWLARKLVNTSLRTDAQLLKPHVAESLKPAYEKLSAGWRGDDPHHPWHGLRTRRRLARGLRGRRRPERCP